jgi:hypothetical protein
MEPIRDETKTDLTDLTGKEFREPPHDFSLVLGGPLYQILRRAHLEGAHLELLNRRVITAIAVAWVPLLVLSSFSLVGRQTFMHDIEVHVRFLISLPILLAAELIANTRLRPAVHRFVERRLVRAEDVPRFDKAIESAIGLRNSALAEVVLIVLVYGFGLWIWHNRVPIVSPTWFALPGGRWNLTSAGYWYVFVSLPIFQFVLLRWYLRFFIWYRFLWHVSRMNLHLISTHPDHCAGLAFVGRSTYAFGPILFAQGVALAGVVASRVLYRGEHLKSFELQIAGFVTFFVLAVLGPLLMFTPNLAKAKRAGLGKYGQLGQDYVEEFEDKWIDGTAAAKRDDLLGSADIQSLADLANGYGVVSAMNMVPFGLSDITRLAAATLAPFVPLLLTVFSPEELLGQVIKAVF